MRIKILTGFKQFKKGDTATVDKAKALKLINSGKAILSKDMTPDDYKQAGDKDGKPSKLRTH